MGQGPRYRVQFRRRREGRTDYRRRLALLKSEKARVVVRRSLKNVIVQFVTYNEVGDQIVAQAEARELPAMGWTGYTSNTPAAYLTGVLAAKRAKDAGVTEGIVDLGLQVPQKGGNLFAAVQGVLDAGVQVPHSPDVLPQEDRLSGAHVTGKDYPTAVAAVYQKITGKARTPKAAPKKAAAKGGAPAGKGAPPAKGGDKGKAAGDKKPAGEKGAAPDKAAKTSKKGAE
ncbi:MAG TPA: 50S ribosomal protein L18 [Candidatus Thermoplasmatota archaeon]|nr:50S ribosomal protein L18 [Candidatus Thermoplasmatota archaeon]